MKLSRTGRTGQVWCPSFKPCENLIRELTDENLSCADISTNVLQLGVQSGVQRGCSGIVCDPLTVFRVLTDIITTSTPTYDAPCCNFFAHFVVTICLFLLPYVCYP